MKILKYIKGLFKQKRPLAIQTILLKEIKKKETAFLQRRDYIILLSPDMWHRFEEYYMSQFYSFKDAYGRVRFMEVECREVSFLQPRTVKMVKKDEILYRY